MSGDGTAIRLEHTQQIMAVRTLVARDPRTNATVRLNLIGTGLKRQPAGELQALAGAIMAGREPGAPGYASAEAVARELMAMAEQPFPV